MPTPTDQLNEDIQAVRTDVSGLKTTVGNQAVATAEIQTEMGHLRTEVKEMRTDLQGLRTDLQRLSVDMASLNTKVNIGGGLVGLVALAILGGIFNGSNRLSALEVETRISSQSFDRRLSDLQSSVSRHQVEPEPELDTRIERIVNRVVDAAIKRTSVVKPPE